MSVDIKEKFDTLNELIDTYVKLLSTHSNRTKKKALILKLTSILTSGVVTFIIGLKANPTWQDVALFFSTLLTVLTTLETYLNYTDKLVFQVNHLNKLTSLRMDIQLYQAGNDHYELEKFDEFKKRFDQLHQESNQERLQILSKKSGTSKNVQS